MPYRTPPDGPAEPTERRYTLELGDKWRGQRLVVGGALFAAGVAAVATGTWFLVPTLAGLCLGAAFPKMGLFPDRIDRVVLDLDADRLLVVRLRPFAHPERYSYDLRYLDSFRAEPEPEKGKDRGRVVAPYVGGTMIVFRSSLADCESAARILEGRPADERGRRARAPKRARSVRT